MGDVARCSHKPHRDQRRNEGKPKYTTYCVRRDAERLCRSSRRKAVHLHTLELWRERKTITTTSQSKVIRDSITSSSHSTHHRAVGCCVETVGVPRLCGTRRRREQTGPVSCLCPRTAPSTGDHGREHHARPLSPSAEGSQASRHNPPLALDRKWETPRQIASAGLQHMKRPVVPHEQTIAKYERRGRWEPVAVARRALIRAVRAVALFQHALVPGSETVHMRLGRSQSESRTTSPTPVLRSSYVSVSQKACTLHRAGRCTLCGGDGSRLNSTNTWT
jgi:hypothetical protein